jgi:hypothetical protein
VRFDVTKQITLLVLSFLCGLPQSAAIAQEIATYPSNASSLVSPDGRFALRNVDRDQTLNHQLLLVDRRTHATKSVLFYGRHVEVSWSPRSERFFVNDYRESNEATCLIWKMGARRPIDIQRVVDGQRPKKLALELAADHLYIHCLSWEAPDRVLVAVDGHDSTRRVAFDRRVSVDAGTGRAVVMK